MAYENKAALKVAIADNLNRTDLTDLQLNRFIRDAETRANRLLRLREDICRSEGVVTAGTEYIGLPSDYAGLYIVKWTDASSVTTSLKFLDIGKGELRTQEAESGTPEFYSIVGPEIRLIPVPAEDGTLGFFVKERFELEDDDDSNTLLETNADIYLHGCLYEAKTFLREPLDEIAAHEQRFLTGIRELRISDWHDKQGGQDGDTVEFF